MFRTLSAAPSAQPAGDGYAATLCPPVTPVTRPTFVVLLDSAIGRLRAAGRRMTAWNDRRLAIAEFRRLDARLLGDIGLDPAQARAVVDAMLARRRGC